VTAQQIEHQIEQVLATETDASRLSRRLFDTDGLFGQLAPTEAERRTLTQTALFRQALQRLTELQRREAADYTQELASAGTDGDAGAFEPGREPEPAPAATPASPPKIP
jgi:hypothetical protein